MDAIKTTCSATQTATLASQLAEMLHGKNMEAFLSYLPLVKSMKQLCLGSWPLQPKAALAIHERWFHRFIDGARQSAVCPDAALSALPESLKKDGWPDTWTPEFASKLCETTGFTNQGLLDIQALFALRDIEAGKVGLCLARDLAAKATVLSVRMRMLLRSKWARTINATCAAPCALIHAAMPWSYMLKKRKQQCHAVLLTRGMGHAHQLCVLPPMPMHARLAIHKA